MSVLRIINSYTDQIELSQFKDISNQICCDLAFQANETTRWSDDQRSAFITSFITNKAPSPLIFADIAACLANAIKYENIADIEYFERWSKLGKYMNLDGNNRVICLGDFIQGRVAILPGVYYVGGSFHTIVAGKNDTISTLPKAMLVVAKVYFGPKTTTCPLEPVLVKAAPFTSDNNMSEICIA